MKKSPYRTDVAHGIRDGVCQTSMRQIGNSIAYDRGLQGEIVQELAVDNKDL